MAVTFQIDGREIPVRRLSEEAFQVEGREVSIKRFPELSEKTQEIVQQYSFTPPKVSSRLKEYDSRIQDITNSMNRDKKEYREALATGIIYTAAGIGILVLSIIGCKYPFIFPAIIIGGMGFYSLYMTSKWNERNRITIGEEQLKNLKREAEEYLYKFSQYYKHQGEYLKDALDKEIKKGKNLVDLIAAKEEIDLCNGIRERFQKCHLD